MSLPFETPTTMMLAGPTQSGKSYWVNKLIMHKKTCLSQHRLELLIQVTSNKIRSMAEKV